MARRPVRSTEKFEALLNAAAELFAERGFAATRVEDILALATEILGLERPMTRGALYQFFKDKDDIAGTLVTESLIMEDIVPLAPRLQTVIDRSITLAVLTPRVTLIKAAHRLATEQGKPWYGHIWRSYIPLVTELLTQARDLGELRPGMDPSEWAQFWVDAWVGLDLRFRDHYFALADEVNRMNRQVVDVIAVPDTRAQLILSVTRGRELVPHSAHADAYFASMNAERRGKVALPS